jgi:malonyl-CoA O-methyltransferase
MNIVQEFSRFANQYDSYNSVQSQVAKKLVSMIEAKKYNNIIDIGCGSGLIYKNIIDNHISFKEFTALDFSLEMLDIHPCAIDIKKIHFDFNKQENFKQLKKYDFVISSSALQWSRDLDMTLREISNLSTKCYLSIFTSNTFSTLHKVANIKSPIYSEEYIKNRVTKYFNCSFETIKYHITFSSVHQMFQYIKRSGVSGGDRQLSYAKTKELIKNYPLNYLEFEVLFIVGSISSTQKINRP